MNIGQIVSMKSAKIVVQNGDGWLEYKAPKGKAFAFMFAGMEDLKGPYTNGNEVLKSMGWEFKSDQNN